MERQWCCSFSPMKFVGEYVPFVVCTPFLYDTTVLHVGFRSFFCLGGCDSVGAGSARIVGVVYSRWHVGSDRIV